MSSYVRKYVSLKEDFYIKDSLFQKQPLTDSLQNRCSEKFCKFHRKIPVLESLQALGLQLYSKETPTQLFSCGICKIFKNTFFHRTPPVAFSLYTIVPFFKFWCLFHSFIYYRNLLFYFASLENVPSLVLGHTRV